MSGFVPSSPLPRLALGVVGHRESNPAFADNRDAVCNVLTGLFKQVDAIIGEEAEGMGELAPVRLHTMLADGVDQVAARRTLARGWELVVPLPFGRDLNVAINALPTDPADAESLAHGKDASDPGTQSRAQAIRDLHEPGRLFELADRDAELHELHQAMLSAPDDLAAAQAFAAHSSEQVALACRVLIEQSDFLIAVWDGKHHNLAGGTGHTIAVALDMGLQVLLIDPARPEDWHFLLAPEALFSPSETSEDRDQMLEALVRTALRPDDADALAAENALERAEKWHSGSSWLWTGYRRIEALFGGEGRPFRSLKQVYEAPDRIAGGSAAHVVEAARQLPDKDGKLIEAIATRVLPQFAWSDAISSRLSDAYRGGMVANFILSALAITAGIAYLPLKLDQFKWVFASTELFFLGLILLITWLGGRMRWHSRWFETRRVAEYLRHSPVMLLLGVARPAARWPRGKDTSWPEYHARHSLRALGLPRMAISSRYLRHMLETLLDNHVLGQRDYHLAKAKRLATVHHRLGVLSEVLFVLAVVSVVSYLALTAAASEGIGLPESPEQVSKLFTFLAVAFPTWAAAIAGIRFFGDFERFAAISDVTAEKLGGIHSRITFLLGAPDRHIRYSAVAEIAHAIDDVVVSEIENWQAVFGGKHITVPA